MWVQVCKLAPEIMEGPYHANETMLRSRIREDQPVVSLTLLIKVVDTACELVADAFVDIWMCNAMQVSRFSETASTTVVLYSGYTSRFSETAGTTVRLYV